MKSPFSKNLIVCEDIIMSEVASTQQQTTVSIEPGSDIVASMTDQFKQDLFAKIHGDIETLIIDLDGVEMIDSVGLGVFIAAYNTLNKTGAKLVVQNCSKNIHSLFKTMRLDQHFEVTASNKES